jgi:predicted transcriptional regulator
MSVVITPEQCRAARAWLGLSAEALGLKASVTTETIRRVERGTIVHASTAQKVRAVLEEAGVRFSFSRDGGALGIEVVKS